MRIYKMDQSVLVLEDGESYSGLDGQIFLVEDQDLPEFVDKELESGRVEALGDAIESGEVKGQVLNVTDLVRFFLEHKEQGILVP